MLTGSLSVSAGLQPINEVVLSQASEDSRVQENQLLERPASLSEQDLELSQLVWHTDFVIPGNDDGVGIVECKDGNYCILGALNISSSYWRTMLVKTDPSGHQIWNQTYVHANATGAECLVGCSDGGFAFAGEFRNDTWMGRDGCILIRTNSTGHPQWNTTFLDMILFRDILQTDDGGFILLGIGKSLYGYEYDIIIVKTDENGTTLWTGNYGMFDTQEGYSIVQCSSGGYAISGTVHSYSAPTTDTFLMRVTESGALLWFRTYSNDVVLYGSCVLECENGDFLIGGDPGMLRTDSAGNPKSSINLYGAVSEAIIFDSNRIIGTQRRGLRCTDGNDTLVQTYPVGFWLGGLIRCTDGEFIVAGHESGDINVARVPWLDWNQTLNEIDFEYAESLAVKLNATCSQGISSWSVNDTARFDIDSQGVLTNVGLLAVGEYPVEIVVNDTLGNQLIQRFTVIVQDTTAPTWLETPGTLFLEAGEAFLYDLNASDASGSTFWSLGATDAFSIDQDGVVTNTLPLTVGIYLIYVFVEDISGNILDGVLTLEVVDTQGPIFLSPPEDLIVPYGELIEFDIIAYDVSGIAVWSQNCTDFTILLDRNGPTAAAHFTSVGVLNPDTYVIETTVADPSVNVLQDVFWIIVTEDDISAPTWTQEPVTQYLEFGDTFSYDLNASDSSGIDNWWLGDDTYFSVDGTGLITENAPLEVGVYTIAVFVNDTLGNTLSCSVLVLVSDTTAPVWATAPVNQTIMEDEPLDYQLFASDLSGVSSWQVNDTAHFSVDSQGHLRNIISLGPGVYWVEITVSDMYGNDLSTSISITVWKSTETITTTTTTTPTSTEGVLGSTQIILLGLGSGIGGAALVIIIYQIVKRR